MQPEQPAINKNQYSINNGVETQFSTICNLCSVGCTLSISMTGDTISGVQGKAGLINELGQHCEYPETGYKFLNKSARITQPLIRRGNTHQPISWKEALETLNDEIVKGDPAGKAFFAGARLTNEEQYLIMKTARACAYTNNIGSFHYFGRGTGYTRLSRANIPFAELIETKKIIVIGGDIVKDNPVAAKFIFDDRKEYNIPVTQINTRIEHSHDFDENIRVKSVFHFVKAVNYLLVSKGNEDKLYISNLIDNFEIYRNSLLSLNFDTLADLSGVSKEVIEKFTEDYRNEPHAVIVFSEKELSGHACGEIFNLALLTGKHGRTGAGLLLLKENNNSHGLHDMGAMWNLGPGAVPWDDPFQSSTVQFIWGSKDLSTCKFNALHKMRESGYEKLFILGEDPIGCAVDKIEMTNLLKKSRFIMVQDYFMTPTAEIADLVIPASLPYETGGTFTNTQRVIQKVDKRAESPLEFDSWRQLENILIKNGYGSFETIDDVTFEIASLLPKFCTSSKLMFRLNEEDNLNIMFNAGCDALFRESLLI